MRDNDLGNLLASQPLIDGEGNKHVITEGDIWVATRLGLINAVIDTVVPGLRLAVALNEDEKAIGVTLIKENIVDRPRNLPQSLRDLADSIEALGEEQPVESMSTDEERFLSVGNLIRRVQFGLRYGWLKPEDAVLSIGSHGVPTLPVENIALPKVIMSDRVWMESPANLCFVSADRVPKPPQ